MASENPEIQCARCGKTGAAPAAGEVTYGGALGDEIRSKTCAACWEEWVAAEVMFINELRLNFMDPKSQDILIQQLREFLALDGGTGTPMPSAGKT